MKTEQKKAGHRASERRSDTVGTGDAFVSIDKSIISDAKIQDTKANCIGLNYTGKLDLPDIQKNLDLFKLRYSIQPGISGGVWIEIFTDRPVLDTRLIEHHQDILSPVIDNTYNAETKSWSNESAASERPVNFEPIHQNAGQLWTITEIKLPDDEGYHFDTALDLYKADLPEITFFIEQLLPQGLGFLAGESKVGKSHMALQMANDIASGRRFLLSTEAESAFEGFSTEQVPVLYYSLEMAPNLLQNRLHNMYPHGGISNQLFFAYSHQMSRLDEGGFEMLVNAIKQTKARVIFIDVFGKISSSKSAQKGELYGQAYDEMSILQKISNDNNCSIILLTHLNKSTDSDGFTRIMGSTANRGAADFSIVMSKKDGQILLLEESRKAEGLEIVIELGRKPALFEFVSSVDDIQKQQWLDNYLHHPVVNAIKVALSSADNIVISAAEMLALMPGWAADKYTPQKIGRQINQLRKNLKFYDEIIVESGRNNLKRGYEISKPKGKTLTPVMDDFIEEKQPKDDRQINLPTGDK